MTEKIINFILEFNPFWIYVFLFFSTFTENVFPPWPGDTFIIFSGFLLYHKILDPFWTFFVTTLGNFLGAYLMYFLGETILDLAHKFHQKIQIKVLKSLLEGITAEEQKQRTEILFRNWGFWFVVVSRFSAGIRYFVSIIAGITKMNLFLFSFAFFIAVIIWNGILFWAGYFLADNWKKALEWLKLYNYTIGTFLLLIVVFLYILFIKEI